MTQWLASPEERAVLCLSMGLKWPRGWCLGSTPA
eukprot:CAMPEP_0204162032 /NCGR_PEP_ID=MMETSP0361-20130328/35225_1 /ASSEMBLY_ACC=CAM_ASM_000343 /TAXON_ID=268821 /ORGANISM="Scrippsiella Hangoei, Strain SHTV-5" /LENGTH=33 /DNA_ID= /DNA_START= /DNA_END= /DNA_ORIENTATION=